ncbi:PLAT domain-containing protein 2-like [Mercurialis annua]|uniref:PLAT domain-containing protein 2-like n=1 Tax=Mercurialis annua TaxID=3986 RepID=UPI002160A81A|nr:PLAT domain-containing protein 2-like [Mercurialis annua]
MTTASFILSFLICIGFLSVVLSERCTYSISVKTGTKSHAGTDAVVSLKLSSLEDPAIYIPNLEKYGLMGAGHDYFENGNLDLFSYTGPCFPTPVCYIKLSHDNSGDYPGWFVSYVQIETSGGPITPTKKYFEVEQWLADDEPPYLLSTCRDLCPNDNHLIKSDVGIGSLVDATV